jgi:glycine/D-amino acid oxidase-like deaminating enzyme
MTSGSVVLIVGGGLMGLSAAWHLRRADPTIRVRVLERERAGAAASGASAAGVRAMFRDPAERPLALAALTRWPHLDRELEGDTRYRRGGLRVALDAESWALTEAEVAAQRAGAFLIGSGWPADVPAAHANRLVVRDDSVAGNLAAAREVYPPLAARTVAQRWAGIEAFGDGDLPTLGPVPGVAGLLVAVGFSGHGFALAPVVGDVLARLALGREPLSSLWGGLGWRPTRRGGDPLLVSAPG